MNRSWLYVPAHRPELFAKALAGPADAIVVDLEDAVPADQKERARAAVAELVGAQHDRPVWVRINHHASPWARDDVRAVARSGLAGLRVPKCESAETVRAVISWLDAEGCDAMVHPLLESALGVERAYEIALASPRVALIGLGEADLRADMRVRDDGLAYARSRVVTAARAAGLPGPVMSVYTRLGDPERLRVDTRAGRALGFFGRSAVHPNQVPVINDVFTPSRTEVAEARELLATLRTAIAMGRAALRTRDGRFVDPAVAESARWVLLTAGEEDAGPTLHSEEEDT
ncbi:CoA ester lyase [Actinoallomurus acanthiterrae]